MGNKIDILIQADDNASKVLQTVGDNAKKMWSDMWSMSKSVSTRAKNNEDTFKSMRNYWAIALWALSWIVAKTIWDFSDAEKASNQLRHAVIDVTHATEDQLKATSDLADELERKWVLDWDNIKMWQAQLSTFWLSNKAVQWLSWALADLAVNQFWASASWEQLSDTANMIAKALNWQFWVLEKSGIRFTDAQKNMIQFGTEMEKVKAINEWFNQNLKYTNEVALQWLDGKTAKLKVQMWNLSESIGKALTPAFQELISSVQPIIERFTEWAGKNPELLAKLVEIWIAVAWLVTVLWTLWIIIPSVITWITALWTAVWVLTTIWLWPLWIAIVWLTALFIIFSQKSWEATVSLWDMSKASTDSANATKIAQEALDEYNKHKLDTKYNVEQLEKERVKALELQKQLEATLRAQQALAQKAMVQDQATAWQQNQQWWVAWMWQYYLGQYTNATIWLQQNQANTSTLQKKAMWWPVNAGQTYIVGEVGPELFTPSVSWNITPNNKLWSASVNINMWSVHVHNEADEDRLIEKISSMLTRQVELYKLGVY